MPGTSFLAYSKRHAEWMEKIAEERRKTYTPPIVCDARTGEVYPVTEVASTIAVINDDKKLFPDYRIVDTVREDELFYFTDEAGNKQSIEERLKQSRLPEDEKTRVRIAYKKAMQKGPWPTPDIN